MKTKLEELRAAYEAEPYGLSASDADMMEARQVRFYDAAHVLMPQLLEGVEILESLQMAAAHNPTELFVHHPDVVAARKLLEKLK